MTLPLKQVRNHFQQINKPLVLLALLTPFTTYLVMQFVQGCSIFDFSLLAIVGNSLCIGVVFFALFALIGNVFISSLLCHLLFGIFGAANYFVSIFRGTPVLPWDFTALQTAAAVAGSYDLIPTWRMVFVIAILLAMGFWIYKKRPASLLHFMSWKFRLGSLAICVYLYSVVAFSSLLSSPTFKPDVWNQTQSYKQGGAVAVFLRNLEFLQVEEPTSPSLEELDQHLSALPISEQTQQTPNIIAIMNESWADFEEFGNLSLNKSVNSYISSLPNSIWGHCYTSVFGAGTSTSEFEFLTGNSMAFLSSGSIPYQQYITRPSSSIVSTMKANGYRTVAIHPGEETSWQRNIAYPLLGFDAFKSQETLDVPIEMEREYISDATSFQQIIWEFENKAPNEKLFVFNVTIQSHGGYTDKTYPAEVTLTDAPGQFPKAEQYLTLASKTDQAFPLLVDYFSQQEEPTIILMFGDHQPFLEQEFLDKAYGVTQDKMTMEQYMDKYRTPFVIWANYPLPDSSIPDTSLNFLSQYLLRYSGLPQSTFDQYLWELHKTMPAMTFVGYTDAQGNAYSHLETNEFTPLIQEYRALQYNNLFGKSNRQGQWFAPLALP